MDIKEGEELQDKGIENIFNKIIGEIFPNLEKETTIQVYVAYRTPNRKDQKRNTPRYIIAKTLNMQNKERMLKFTREKHQVTNKGKPPE
jgi:hypothetical protein